MGSYLFVIFLFISSIALFLYTGKKFFDEKKSLLASNDFLAIYKQVYDSFAQSAGVPSVERLRYSGTFPPSAFRIQRKLKLTDHQKVLLNNYRSQVKKAYNYLALAILLLVIMLLMLLYLIFILV